MPFESDLLLQSYRRVGSLSDMTRLHGYAICTACYSPGCPCLSDKKRLSEDDATVIREVHETYKRMKVELANVIVGQTDVIDEVLMAVFSRGHALLVGVPGLARTLLISTLSKVLRLSFKRIQFTPDLMPSDIIIDFARDLARATRPKEPESPDIVREMVGWGAGPPRAFPASRPFGAPR